ncbi:MAG: hypothetical protein BWK78_04545, partial [Thiotrichaceae bacterium IS1]
QLGRIYKAQKQWEEAFCPYERAATYLQLVQNTYAYPGVSQTFRESKENFYLDRADFLIQTARIANQEWHDLAKEQSLLNSAIQTIELLKETELQNYFQDDCITEKKFPKKEAESPKKLPVEIATKMAVLYIFLFDKRVELLLSSQNGNIQSFPVHEKTRSWVIQQAKNFAKKVGELSFQNKRRDSLGELGCNDINYTMEQKFEKCSFDERIDYRLERGELYNTFFPKDLVKTLDNKQIDTLIIVPDSELLGLPFAALWDGQKYLVEKYALAIAYNSKVGIYSLVPGTVQKTTTTLLNGLTDSINGAQTQLDDIETLVDARRPLLTDREFTVSNVGDQLKTGIYSVAHFVTHGHFEEGTPTGAYLEVYDNKKLTMDDLESFINFSIQEKDKPLDLLSLSACQSALGDKNSQLGLAGIAVKAGSHSALGTLWLVYDVSTTQLIIEFYKGLSQRSDSFAKALQQAQLTLLHPEKDGTENFLDPYFWAGFILVGGIE